jgi:hypothetical protein
MPPEQFDGAVVDGSADQFAFCVALYEALHGVRPFAGRTVAEVRAAIERGVIATAAVPRRIPARIERALRR